MTKTIGVLLIFLIIFPKSGNSMGNDEHGLLPIYTGVFSRKIYDQSNIEIQNRTQAQIDAQCVDSLKTRKLGELENKVLIHFRRKMEIFLRDVESLELRAFYQNILNAANGTIGGVGRLAEGMIELAGAVGIHIAVSTLTLPTGPGGEVVGNLAVSPLSIYLGTQFLSNTVGGGFAIFQAVLDGISQNIINSKFPEAEVLVLQREFQLMYFDIKRLVDGLDCEPVNDLEQEYVKRKRNLVDSNFIDQIESAFLQARYPEGFNRLILQRYLEQAVRVANQETLPIGNLELSIDERYTELLNRFERDPYFQFYSDQTKTSLRRFVTSAFRNSNVRPSEKNKVLLRQCYFFQGEPSSGKSFAARYLAEFLGVPSYSPPTFVEGMFKPHNLRGEGWSALQNTNLGWFSTSILQDGPNGRAVRNAILILDDFDRTLFEGGDNSNYALKFLMDITDDNPNRKFHSDYFDCDLDISELTIIITSNLPFPSDEKYKALFTRIRLDRMIKFDQFTPHKRNALINRDINDMFIRFNLSNLLTASYDGQKIKVTVRPGLENLYGIPDNSYADVFEQPVSIDEGVTFRESRGPIEVAFEDLTINIKSSRLTYYNRASSLITGDHQEYVNAAILGHPDAIMHMGDFYKTRNWNYAKNWYLLAYEQQNPRWAAALFDLVLLRFPNGILDAQSLLNNQELMRILTLAADAEHEGAKSLQTMLINVQTQNNAHQPNVPVIEERYTLPNRDDVPRMPRNTPVIEELVREVAHICVRGARIYLQSARNIGHYFGFV